MKQEDYLREAYGSENHFRIPEDYFDKFARRMMEQIPEKAETLGSPRKHVSLLKKAKPYLYLAAMFCGLFFCIKVVEYQTTTTTKKSETAPVAATVVEPSDRYVDDLCDYAGIDGEQIYAYLTGSDANL